MVGVVLLRSLFGRQTIVSRDPTPKGDVCSARVCMLFCGRVGVGFVEGRVRWLVSRANTRAVPPIVVLVGCRNI